MRTKLIIKSLLLLLIRLLFFDIKFSPTCQAPQPLLSPDAGETASLHCRHQMMFPTQELLIGHFQFQVVKHRVDTLDKRRTLVQCITVSCQTSFILFFT